CAALAGAQMMAKAWAQPLGALKQQPALAVVRPRQARPSRALAVPARVALWRAAPVGVAQQAPAALWPAVRVTSAPERAAPARVVRPGPLAQSLPAPGQWYAWAPA